MKELIANPKRLATWNFWLWVSYGVYTSFIYFPLEGGEFRSWMLLCTVVGGVVGVVFAGLIWGAGRIDMPRKLKWGILLVFIGVSVFLLIQYFQMSIGERILLVRWFNIPVSHIERNIIRDIVVPKVFFSLMIILPCLSFVSVLAAGEFKKDVGSGLDS